MAKTAEKDNVVAFPKTPGAAIDLLYSLRTRRLEMQREVDAVKEQEDALQAHLLASLDAAELDGAKGRVATASVKTEIQAKITDFSAYVAYCVKSKALSMLQQRVGITALRERWDAGKTVPGVEQVSVVKLSLTKAGAR